MKKDNKGNCIYREGDFCNYDLVCLIQEYVPPYHKPICNLLLVGNFNRSMLEGSVKRDKESLEEK